MLIQLLTACFNLILLIEGGYLLTHRHRPLFNLHLKGAVPMPGLYLFWGVALIIVAVIIEILALTCSVVITFNGGPDLNPLAFVDLLCVNPFKGVE